MTTAAERIRADQERFDMMIAASKRDIIAMQDYQAEMKERLDSISDLVFDLGESVARMEDRHLRMAQDVQRMKLLAGVRDDPD